VGRRPATAAFSAASVRKGRRRHPDRLAGGQSGSSRLRRARPAPPGRGRRLRHPPGRGIRRGMASAPPRAARRGGARRTRDRRPAPGTEPPRPRRGGHPPPSRRPARRGGPFGS